MRFNECDEAIFGKGKIDIPLHTIFSYIEIDLFRFRSHIAKIGIGHLAGAVDNATHDRDFYSGQVGSCLADAPGDLLQIE